MNDLKNFQTTCHQLFSALELCVNNKLTLPALSLIYSGIDTFGWLAYGDIKVKDRFVQWVENHMYKAKRLAPEPIDLYAARCAILHTFTPDSDLSKKKAALPITYAWGTATTEALQDSINKLKPGEYTCVHLNDLLESFQFGAVDFLETALDDPECIRRMSKHYSQMDRETVESFNMLSK